MTAAVRRGVTAVAIALLAAPLGAAPAKAHASLLSSEPADGSSAPAPPDAVVLTFTEPPDLTLSSVRVLDGSGGVVAGGPGRARAEDARGTVVAVALPRLPDGSFTVSWRVVSRVDGHLTAGAFTFGVGRPAGPAATAEAPASPPPSPLAVAGRLALYAGVALLWGAALAGLVVFRRALPSWCWALPLCWLVAWAGFGLVVATQLNRTGVGLGAFLSSDRGGRLVREGVALAVAGGAAALAAFARPAWTRVVLAGAAAAAIVAHAAAGHAAAGPAAQVAAHSIHLIAVATWIGGLPWLAAGLAGEERRGDAAARFANTAAVAIVVVAATGIVRAWSESGSLGALTGTSFGRTVLVKTGLFAVLLALGAANHFRNVPRLRTTGDARALFRTVGAEIALAVVVLGATGLLTELQPARSAAAERRTARPEAVVVRGSDVATSVRATLTIAPGRPGFNELRVTVVDYDTRRTVEASAVDLRVSLPSQTGLAPSTIAMRRSGDGWVANSSALSLEGEWRIVVQIRTPARSVQVPLTARVAVAPSRVEVSRVPGQPTLYTVRVPGTGSVQVYADPGAAGDNQVHATFFDERGRELAVTSPAMRLFPESGSPPPISLLTLGPGHFVADVRLVAGRYRLAVAGTGGGRRVSVTIDIEIEARQT